MIVNIWPVNMEFKIQETNRGNKSIICDGYSDTDYEGNMYPLRWVQISGQNGHVNIYYSLSEQL